MKNLVICLFLLQIYLSQTACPDGTFASITPLVNPEKGVCTTCSKACKTCSDHTSCITYNDALKGFTSGSPQALVCPSGALIDGVYGYNKNLDVCDMCI
jgi:hypothetical protein